MKPRFPPDLQDWSGRFAGSASIATDANFAWAWSDGAQDLTTQDIATQDLATHHAAAHDTGADGAADTSLLSPDIDAAMLQATGDGDATGLRPAGISDGNPPLQLSDTAPIAAEGGGAATAPMSFVAVPSAGHASSGLLSDALATPPIVPVAAHAPEAGPGYSDPIAAVAHPDAQIFFTGLPANGGEPAVMSVALATVHSATDPSAGPILANPTSPAEVSQNPITDASVGAHGATATQVQQALDESGLSINGSGIKVGVLSDSFNDLGGAALDEADGALPSAANVQILADISSGGSDEGRAMMQIVHDIAPGSSLAFYTAFQSEQSFANGILALAAAGCKVICDDVSYYDESFFGGGVIAQAIQTVEAEGVTYITSAGNDASNAYQAAWTPISGSFDGRNLTDAESFGGSIVQNITVSASSSETVPLLLEWNQAYGAATTDLEILVFHNGSLVGAATNWSSGEPSNPWIDYTFTASGTYQIAVENLSGPNPGLIKEIAAGDGLPVTIGGADAGTVFGHAMTPGVIAVGAVSTADTPAFGFSTPASESFSSSGAGSELLFATNGAALSSPDAINPVVVSSVDNIATTVSGGLGDFYGTSAASASLAGVAALVLAANPNLTPAQVEQIMEETATPMFNSAVSGAGLVNVDAAVAAAEALLVKVMIESFGVTGLVQLGHDFYLDSNSSGTGPELVYGTPVVANQTPGWSLIGGEQTAGGYEVAWENASTDQFTVWGTDSNGNVVSNLTGGVVSGSSAALESIETSFHQDLNGDGTIGPVATVIESFGSTSLVEVGNNYYLHGNSSGTGPELVYGTPVVANQTPGWSLIGAEQIASGYEVAWENASTDQFTVWGTDSNGNVVSNLTGGVVSGSSAALESIETSFHQDLNGDGTIGPVATVIESFGSTSLVEVGNNYYLHGNSSGTGPELDYGTPVVANQTPGWSLIGGEQTASGYEVAWENASTDQFTVWGTDSNGNVVSNLTGGVVSGSSAALESIETSFHQDLNGDGTIGVVAQNSSAISMAIAAATGSTAHDNFVFHPALGQQLPANPAQSGTIAPEDVAHFTHGNQATGFWSDNHAGNAQTLFQLAPDGQGETADTGNHDLANALSVHHAELMHAYLIH